MISRNQKKQCTWCGGMWEEGGVEGGGDGFARPLVPTNPNSEYLNSKED